ncbi:hypothetical protein RUND412_001370 [Rhizina undulata]
MKLTMRSCFSLGLLVFSLCAVAIAAPHSNHGLIGRKPNDYIIKRDDNGLQSVVTWDDHSLLINGERVFIFSGEFHPWRLPVSSLWLDVFEKIKALGFNAVSFYVHWGLVEYKQGDFNFDGHRSYTPFFEAARQAGIYLIARPGPYINAETTGGGFPGWGVRVEGAWRSANETYLEAIKDYVSVVGKMIAKEQITEGGPVILLQPENEFSIGEPYIPWPQSEYMQILQDEFRAAGIVVPLISNDVWGGYGNYVPGSGEGEVDIYGYDGYPLGFDCANPYTWGAWKIPTWYWRDHEDSAPKALNAVMEFQGGAFDPWGGPGYEACSILLNNEFERVFYKNMMAMSTTILNLYMTFGGTNWGGLAYPGVYTSYDYGSAITETRQINREKYSELKLQANFLKVSPAYLTTQPQNILPEAVNGSYSDSQDIAITKLADVVGNKTVFWVTRHSAYNSLAKTSYKLKISTSSGAVSIPQLSGTLTLNGRDSKVHVSDYNFGDKTILYSSGEIFTWEKFSTKHVLVLYGSSGETHETAFTFTENSPAIETLSGTGLTSSQVTKGVAIINYKTSGQTVIQIGDDLLVFLVDRNTAYQFWVPNLPGEGSLANYSTEKSVIVKAGYLIRSAEISGGVLYLKGDVNATTPIEVIADVDVTSVQFNGKNLGVSKSTYGSLLGSIDFSTPTIDLPELSSLDWKYADSLPEISSTYDDSGWASADKTDTPNPRKLTTPTNLYASDYGFHTGNLLWRGHFTATGKENGFNVTVIGGSAFSFSVWLNSDLLGSFYGYDAGSSANKTFTFSALVKGSTNIITILQDNQGLNEDWTGGSEDFKTPRGILNWSFPSSPDTVIAWKLTGNLGGENYIDRVRGPFNEGGLYAERQGWHLPGFDTSKWQERSPFEGIEKGGVGFFKTDFTLNLPTGYDIPLAFTFTNSTATFNFRSQLYVNGYQFGKYVNNVGPQVEFPVPEGIINHQGTNSLGLSIWGLDNTGARLDGLKLVAKAVVATGYGDVVPEEQPVWTARTGAY